MQKETDEMSKERLAGLRKRDGRTARFLQLHESQWENEKNAIDKVQSLRAEVETTKAEIEKATRNGDYAKAASCNTAKLPACSASWKPKKSCRRQEEAGSLLRDRVTAEEIAASWPAGPASLWRSWWRASAKLLHLADVLHQRVIGQDEAVQKGRRPSCAPAPASPTRTAPSAASCSLAPRAWARPSWPRRWPRPCLTTKRTWCVSI